MPRRFIELKQFSFRLAFMIDIGYVGVGALGGAVLGRGIAPSSAVVQEAPSCRAASTGRDDLLLGRSPPPLIRDLHEKPVSPPLEIRQLR